MKFTLKWLKQHLDTDATLDQICVGLVGVGLEVEGIEDKTAALAGFSICKVKEARQHPNADRLRVCDVETINGMVQVVCGAPMPAPAWLACLPAPAPMCPVPALTLRLAAFAALKVRACCVRNAN